jgi:ectoine hydroxylase-related dioxygenase (phytanoyl-CoA dioxygenase family)
MEVSQLEKMHPMKVREPRYSSERHRFFQQRGWIKVDEVLTRNEVKEALDELKRIQQGELVTSYQPGKSAVAYQSSAKYARVADKTVDVSRYSEVFHRIATLPKIGAIVKEVTGLPSLRLFGDQLIMKGPAAEGGIGSQFHQDLPFYPIDRCGGATMWIALDDLPAKSGTLRFIEGSHRWGAVGRGTLNGWLVDHPADAELVTEANDVAAGSATIHDQSTLHGTDPNKWDKTRYAYMITFMPANACYNGMPSRWTDGLGLKIDSPFDHVYFPVIG